MQPFNGSIYFCYGDFEDFLREIHGKIDEVEEANIKTKGFENSLGLTTYAGNSSYIFISREHNTNLSILLGSTVHEIMHAIFHTLDCAGYSYNTEGQELYCYYHNSVLETVLNQLDLINIHTQYITRNEDTSKTQG